MPKKKKKIKKDKQTIILTIIFILLSILVIGLIIDFIIVKNRVDNEKKVNINIPVLDSNAYALVSINISNKKKDDVVEYVFRVRNYQDKINKKEVKYDIILSTDSNVEYNITKDNKELKIKDNKITNLKLKAKTKEDIIYNLKIKVLEDTKKDSNVVLSVVGS